MIYPCSNFTAKIWVKYSGNKWQSGERKYGTIFEHDDKIWKAFGITGLWWGESTAQRWIVLTNGKWCQLFIFLLLCHEIAVEPTVELWCSDTGWCSCEVTLIGMCHLSWTPWMSPKLCLWIKCISTVLSFVVFCCGLLQCTHIIHGCFIITGVAVTGSYRICPDTS